MKSSGGNVQIVDADRCSINSMTRKGRFGCAECSKKHRGKSFTQGVVKKVGSLAETMPELSKNGIPQKMAI